MSNSSRLFIKLYIVFGACLFAGFAEAQCTVNAGPTSVNVCQGLSTTLGGSPTVTGGNGTEVISWNNGAGNTANPSVTPSATTTYTVTVTGGGCQPGLSDQITLNVLPLPIAGFTFAPNNTPCANVPINFTNTTTGCTGCEYSWDFGDGTPASTAANPTHTFNTAIGDGNQTFTVTLTVTAANGCVDTQTATVTVKRIPDPVLLDPFFSQESFLLCDGQSAVSLEVAGGPSGATVTNYSLNWGDGSPVYNGATPPNTLTHNYTVGLFNLVYTLTGTNGCVASQTFPVYNISNPAISTGSLGGTQGCGPIEFCFTLDDFQSNDPSTYYEISYGDGSPAFTVNHNDLLTSYCHTYTTTHCPGSGFIFTVNAVNGCSETPGTVGGIKVGTPPNASFTANPTTQCVNVPIQFVNNSSSGFNFINCNSGTTYTWNWGDGTPNVTVTSTATQSHAYTAPGSYTVTLTATHAQCGSHVLTQQVCIETPPVPQFTLAPTPICINNNQNVAVVNTSTSSQVCSSATTAWVVDYAAGACPPNTGLFNYMSGTSSTSLQPVFQFTSVGTYTVRLQMTNSCGMIEDTEPVVVNTTPTATINIPASICAGTSGTFSATTSGCGLSISNYQWTFTGGTPATFNGQNPPPISYATQGNYNVSLVVTNACGTTTATGTVSVLAAPNVVITPANNDFSICNGQSTILTATGAGSFTWSPATYLSSTIGNQVTANPTAPITYTVTGTSGTCTDTETISLTISPLPVVQPSGTFVMCQGETIQLGVNESGGSGTYTSYAWSPATGLSSTTIENPVSSVNTTTNYSVDVTDSNGCIGTGIIPVTVNPLPATNAGPDITLCNQPVATPLTGYSPTSGGVGIWTGTGVTPAGVFTPSGVGTTTLTYCFTNTGTGCDACDDMVITVQNPTSANGGPDISICQGNPPVQLPVGVWSASPNVTPSGLYTPTSPMIDDVIVTQGTGSCATNDTIIVTVFALPTGYAGPDVTICAGETVNLAGTCLNCPNGPIDFCTWSGGGVTNALSCTPTTVALNSTTTYNLTIVDMEGCTHSDQITVFVNPLPNTNAGADIIVCNQPIGTQLTGSPAGGTWAGTGVTPAGLFTPTGLGVFTLTYCYTNPTTNCTKCDDVFVTVISPVVANAGSDVEVCHNQPAFNLTPSTIGGTWSAITPGANITPSGTFTPSVTGNYSLLYTIGSGTCLTTDTSVVTVHSLPAVDAGSNASICFGESYQISALINGGQTPYTSLWNIPGTLSNINISNPVATPQVTTTYIINVTDDNQCTASDNITINVVPLPVVEAGNDLTLCNQPIDEVLTGFSPLSGTLGTGVWSGVGISNPSGVYTPAGTGSFWAYYEFTIGNNNCSAIDSILITVVPPVIANAGPDVTLCQNEGVYQLTGFNPATGGTWNGAGVTDAAQGIVQSEIAGVGSHLITIQNGTGTCLTTDQMTLQILPLPTVNAGPGSTVCANDALFNLQGFAPATGGTWEGTGITGASAGTFDPAIGAGTYNLFYHFTDVLTTCSDTAFTSVVVNPVPVANFTLATIGCTNAPVSYTNTSVGATTYQWNYNNGVITDGFQPVYTYPSAGFYNMSLIAQNAFGCADTASNTHQIIEPPVAVLGLSPNEGCAPLNIQFGNTSVGEYMTFDWDLYTTTSTDSIPASIVYHQQDDVAVYPISLTATNQCGSSTDNDNVTVLPQPVASFGTNLNEFCSPFPVIFNNNSVGLPETFEWDFGDGTSAFVEEPGTHVYFTDTVETSYTIYLYLSNQCGLDTASQVITVLPNTVTAFFNTSVIEGCEPLEVTFTNFSDGGTQISYDLGDGNFTGNDNPVHTYAVGDYTIYQYVDNGCSYDTAMVSIQVFDSPDIDFTTNVPNLCVNNVVQMIPETDTATEVSWTFGDGGTSDLSAPQYEYTTAGNFVITMTGVNDNLCTTTVSHPFVVYNGPLASFTVPEQLGCSPFEVCFSNTTTGGNFYSWNFGNGNTSNNSGPCHTYTNVSSEAQLFTVSLIAQNMQLCADTFLYDIIVAPQPSSEFELLGEESCYSPQTLGVNNTSEFANGYEWYVNGQLQSQVVSPQLVFDGVGEYQVQLVTSNQFGCEATSEDTYFIHPLPVNGFEALPLAGCMPLEVNFENAVSGAVEFLWEFGDGGSSETANPSYIYASSGVYDVSLIATTDMGCSDTLTFDDYVTVYSLPSAFFTTDPTETSILMPDVLFYDLSIDAVSWLYQFGDGTTAALPNVMHRYSTPGFWNATLTVYNAQGCRSDYSDVVIINDLFQVFVPNAFTPDGDGINEIFMPQVSGIPFIENYRFQIFNRWGVVIFDTTDPQMPWTGDVRDGEYYAQDDIYNWRIEVQLKGSDEERVYSGHVSVVR